MTKMNNILENLRRLVPGKSKELDKSQYVYNEENLIHKAELALAAFDVNISPLCRENIRRSLADKKIQLGNNNERNIVTLIKNNILDESTIISFEKKAFSLKYMLGEKELPKDIDLRVVLDSFYSNKDYERILLEHGRLHSVELGKLMIDNMFTHPEKHDFENEISNAFYKVTSKYNLDEKKSNHTWIKFFNFSVLTIDTLPSALLDFISNDNCKSLFSLMDSYINHTNAEYMKKAFTFAEIVCRKILSDINEKDVPALLLLGKLYEKKNDYDNARKSYSLAANICFNGVISLINSYENEIRELLNSKYSHYSNDITYLSNKIKYVNSELDSMYYYWISKLTDEIESATAEKKDEIEQHLIIIKTKFARHEKDRKNYEKAYNILESVDAKGNEAYRVYSELGLLHQTSGTKYKKNNYYNPEKAIVMFEKALSLTKDLAESNDTKRIKKSILMPMANTFYSIGNHTKARSICEEVLSLDKNERNAIRLINTLNKREAA